jgi:O-antigen/teichoic acid export membrane protein
MLKRNLIANYLGQGWATLMGLAFIPVYIKFLGIEAYGLIGLFALLQAWLSLMDMGMTPTLSREMARFTGGSQSRESILDLLRSIEIIAVCVAVLIASGISLGSNRIATSWLKPEILSTGVVAEAFAIMGVVTALRFVEGIYRSAIIGLQRQVLFNVVNSCMATLRGLGAVGILVWVSPTIEAFFIWQGTISVATLALLAAITYHILPKNERCGRFSWLELRKVWHFAGGMLGITVLSLLLTQVDKILLSKLLSLGEYGYYTLAATAASAIYMLISPITQAWYPHLCEMHARNDPHKLTQTYHHGAQLVSVIAGSAAVVMILNSETLLRLWTQNYDLADHTAPLLSLLVLGNLLNGLMWIPYQTQLAHGWTSLTVRTNIAAVAVSVPSILWITPRYGAEGAALAWVALNACYVIMSSHFMHRKIMKAEKWRWYYQDILKPLGAAVIMASIIKVLWDNPSTNIEYAAQLIITFLITILAAFLSADIKNIYIKKLINKQ